MIEPLESRIAPATIFAIDESNNLLRFDSATPGTVAIVGAISGLGMNESLRGIDFRPATSELLGVTVTTGSAANSIIKTYLIDPNTAVATLVGATAAALAGAGDVPTGFDFNPAADRMRYVNTNDENARLNPVNGALAANDTDLTPASTSTIIGAAYDRNFANTALTTLYVIDRADSQLGIQGGIDSVPSPNGGVVTDLAPLGFTLDQSNDGGFDIETYTGTGYAALTDAADNLTRLYTINLVTAASATPVATSLGVIGTGATAIRSIAVALPSVVELLNATTAVYTDEDGDRVTVKVSKGALGLDDFRMAVLQDGRGQLRLLNLSDDGNEFQGANLTVGVKKGPQGDGLANVGFIKARNTATGTGIDLGKVSVKGDLALIDVGDADLDTVALAKLSVRTMGRNGLVTQTGSLDLQSDIFGGLGVLFVMGDMQDVTLNIAGGTGPLTIGGSLIGGTVNGSLAGNIPVVGSGRIITTADMGPVKIKGNLVSGAADETGKLVSIGKIASVSIGGSLIGAEGDLDTLGQNGQIVSMGDMGPVKIGRDVIGGGGDASATIRSSGKLASVTVGGSAIGGDGDDSGGFVSIGDCAFVKIMGNLRGGAGSSSGSFFNGVSTTAIPANITVAGSLIGGDGFSSGRLSGRLGIVKIGQDVIGGSNSSSGVIGGLANVVGITSVTIGGSLLGGAAFQSGAITFTDAIGSVKIGRDVIGASINGTDASVDRSAAILGKRIGSVVIGGSLITGSDTSTSGSLANNATIRAGDDIGILTIKGSVIGNVQANGTTPAIISARGQATPGASGDVAIGKVSVGGRVERAQILAGYSASLSAANGNASIGPVKVGGDWIASDLVAGIQDDADTALDDPFGDGDEQLIAGATQVARIASIIIKGIVVGTPLAGDSFSFIANQIGSFSALGLKAPLTSATDGTLRLPLLTADVFLREI